MMSSLLAAALSVLCVASPIQVETTEKSWPLGMTLSHRRHHDHGQGGWIGTNLAIWSTAQTAIAVDRDKISLYIEADKEQVGRYSRLAVHGGAVADVVMGATDFTVDVGGYVNVDVGSGCGVIEFEISELSDAAALTSIAGRYHFDLGAAGDWKASDLKRQRVDRVSLHGAAPGWSASGIIDEWGRKAAVWRYDCPGRSKLVVAWDSGIPNGQIVRLDENNVVRSLENYKMGIQEGASLWFNANGGLVKAKTFRDGLEHGARLEFDQGGNVVSVIVLDAEMDVGLRRRWNESGDQVEAKQAEFDLFDADLVARMRVLREEAMSRWSTLDSRQNKR